MIDLVLDSPVIAPPDDAALDAAADTLGIALPPSYRAFAKRYGFGLSLGLFLVYVPTPVGYSGRAESLVGSARVLGRELRDAVQRGWVRAPIAPDVLTRLVHFAYSENGHRLAWDPADARADGELAIYAIGRGYHPVARVAGDLDAFFERALRPGVDGMFGRATYTLEPTFAPAPVIAGR